MCLVFDLTLRAPINSATGEKVKAYDLRLDLMSPHSVWWSASHDYTDQVITDAQRDQRLCTMVADGLLCPNRLVDAETSSMLGLEKFYSYAGEETGAGTQFLTNLASGNAVWSYDAMQNPSVGPSMFTRVVYNSQDTGDTASTGHDWSVQVGTLNRLGTGLDVEGNNKAVTLIDGDGTRHEWLEDPAKTAETNGTAYGYTRPAGVALGWSRSRIRPTRRRSSSGSSPVPTAPGSSIASTRRATRSSRSRSPTSTTTPSPTPTPLTLPDV